MYDTKAYLIRNHTNLHVGSGDTNYGIVDKQIQRDSASRLPIIHASSLKGALRDHILNLLKNQNEGKLSNQSHLKLRMIFGKGLESVEEKDLQTKLDKLPEQGMVRFFDARLLFVPMRSDIRPYFHATSVETINEALDWLAALGVENLPKKLPTDRLKRSAVTGTKQAMVEDFECVPIGQSGLDETSLKPVKSFFGIEDLALMTEEDFNALLETLPVIARNRLDNGKSVNLWYEEVLPRQSVLLTAFATYENLDASDREEFKKAYRKLFDTLENDLVQIGANASIGYGLCRFEPLGGAR